MELRTWLWWLYESPRAARAAHGQRRRAVQPPTTTDPRPPGGERASATACARDGRAGGGAGGAAAHGRVLASRRGAGRPAARAAGHVRGGVAACVWRAINSVCVLR